MLNEFELITIHFCSIETYLDVWEAESQSLVLEVRSLVRDFITTLLAPPCLLFLLPGTRAIIIENKWWNVSKDSRYYYELC